MTKRKSERDAGNDGDDGEARKRRKEEKRRKRKERKEQKARRDNGDNGNKDNVEDDGGSGEKNFEGPLLSCSPPSPGQHGGGDVIPSVPVFFKKRLEMSISILPARLRDVDAAVEDSLRGFLLKYSDEIDGILLAFENVKLLGDGKGFILNELPYVHYSVAFDALVFNPTVGSTLTGVVAEPFHSHLSLIVFQYFNASIPSDCLRREGYTFDDVTEQWCSIDSNTTPAVGSKVSFQVANIYESAGMISIEGAGPFEALP